MNFRPGHKDEPELNLIPFIDILLVVLIFLVLTTTYSRYSELQINLPTADNVKSETQATEIVVAIGRDGRLAVNGQSMVNPNVDLLARALSEAARSDKNAMVIINADAAATHQSVITVMNAARRVGLGRLTFATQSEATRAAAP